MWPYLLDAFAALLIQAMIGIRLLTVATNNEYATKERVQYFVLYWGIMLIVWAVAVMAAILLYKAGI